MQKMPDYFRQNDYCMPTSMTDTPFQYAYKTNLDNHAYWAKSKPETMLLLQTYLRGYDQSSLWDLYPVQEVLGPAGTLVDVAGGSGVHTEAARNACPGLKARFVLQEILEVLEAAHDLDPTIEKMPCDMMQPQPVQGTTAPA